MGYVLLQDASFWSVAVGSEPQPRNFDALLTAYPPGLDKLSLPHLSSSIPALLAGLFQLPTPVIVVCPIINPTCRCSGRRFSMSHRMVAGHSSSPGETIRDICMTLSLPAVIDDDIRLGDFAKTYPLAVRFSHRLQKERVVQLLVGEIQQGRRLWETQTACSKQQRADAVVGKDGSSQGNTRSRI